MRHSYLSSLRPDTSQFYFIGLVQSILSKNIRKTDQTDKEVDSLYLTF